MIYNPIWAVSIVPVGGTTKRGSIMTAVQTAQTTTQATQTPRLLDAWIDAMLTSEGLSALDKHCLCMLIPYIDPDGEVTHTAEGMIVEAILHHGAEWGMENRHTYEIYIDHALRKRDWIVEGWVCIPEKNNAKTGKANER
jgi:hypothetical protein